MIVKGDYPAAIPSFQRAISPDANFAMAHARLGTCFSNLGQTVRSAESTSRAYDLRERVNERERFYITSHYEHFVKGNLDAARRIYELWAQSYPRDDTPSTNLSVIYGTQGNFEKALLAEKESFRITPASGANYANLVDTYRVLGRPEEAKTTAREAMEHQLDAPAIHPPLYLIAFQQGDLAGMEREAVLVMGKPGVEDLVLNFESDTAAYAGHFTRARELTKRAADSAVRADEKEAAAMYVGSAAVREALAGNSRLATQFALSAVASSNGKDVQSMAAIAFAESGDAARSKRLAEDLSRRFPQDTLVQNEYLPMIRAGVALSAGHSTSAANTALQELATCRPIRSRQCEWLRRLEFQSLSGLPAGDRLPRRRAGLRRSCRVSENSGSAERRLQRNHRRAGPLGRRPGLRTFPRHFQVPGRVSGLPRSLERCRPRHPHPEASEGRVFSVEVSANPFLQRRGMVLGHSRTAE
jgi:tetratricopeptide (TPR) repeat protein